MYLVKIVYCELREGDLFILTNNPHECNKQYVTHVWHTILFYDLTTNILKKNVKTLTAL